MMADSTSGGCQPGEQSFEACLAELQEVVRQLEEGRLGLAESIAGFERGISLLRHCYQSLEQAEQKIEILSGFDQAGNPVVATFEAASTLETGQVTAGRRKQSPAAATQESVSQRTKVAQPAPAPEPEMGSDVSLPDEGQLF
jgi:exodeoxyribonuclease VII small subunit